MKREHAIPFSITDLPYISESSLQPHGSRVDNPITFSQDDWQYFINDFCEKNVNVPEGFADSAHLTYYAARGIEEVYLDQATATPPGIVLYYERYPGMAKNFFYAPDWSIYLNARWLAKRAQLPPLEERTFFTEKTDEVIFVGTPCAYATTIAMEESQHALDFENKILTAHDGNGIKKRTELLVEHDSQPHELRVLKQNLERMKKMTHIFSPLSIDSIQNRIKKAESYQNNDFFSLRFLFKK